MDYDTQIDALVDCGRLDEAISLLGMLEDALLKDKEGRLREIKMQKAQLLFDQRRYRDSLDLFSEVSAPPERVIRLFPPLIAGNASIVAADPKMQISALEQGQAEAIKALDDKTTPINSGPQDDPITSGLERVTTENEASTESSGTKNLDGVNTTAHKQPSSYGKSDQALPLGESHVQFIAENAG